MSTIDARKRWARQMMSATEGPVPAYGTTDWLALPDGDRRKVASVVRAAECWATEGDDLEVRLRAEVEALQVAFKADEDADYQARRDAHREQFGDLAGQVIRMDRAKEARRLMFEGGEAS